jgi:peptide deformylase
MNKDSIITLPNPALKQRSQKVAVITDDTLKLVQEMTNVAVDWENSRGNEICVGLAAVQVNVLTRVVIVREDFENQDNQTFVALINPKVAKLDGPKVVKEEGCLSVPNIYCKVARQEKVKIDALDITGQPIRVSTTGFLSRILQHEVDHTNGICITDHVDEKDYATAFSLLSESGGLVKINSTEELKDVASFLWD